MSMWQVPTIVLALLTWLLSPAASLADAARREALRRELSPRSVRSLTDRDAANLPPRPLPTLPVSPTDVVPVAGSSDAPPPARAGTSATSEAETREVHDETWWRNRMTAAEAALERDELLRDALQSRINVLTTESAARDDPAQRARMNQERTKVLTELEATAARIKSDRAAIEQVRDDARRQGVPPGWIR